MSNNIKFSYFNAHGKRIEYEVNEQDAELEKIFLLEESFSGKIGDVYVFLEEEWKKLDYYND